MSDFRKRAEELVEQMTVEEMASQLRYDAPPIKRLGIPGYNWWNEALHGVARAGTATVFPQAIGMAAMFDEEFLEEIADTIATEARAKFHEQANHGDVDIYKGITMWSPNINIFRDPRWGRGHETYGEDPYLTTNLGLAFIRGLQGNGKYLKTAACAKHFAVHSGPEELRHSFDAVANPKDMEETYLPAFEAAVKEGDVESVMGAYNRTNGEPCCGSETLLVKTLREKWEFKGHVVSDCWAIRDFHENHHVTETAEESAAMALKTGCDLNCGNTYLHMLMALKNGLVTEEEIKESAIRLFTTRVKLGLFDEDCEYANIPYEENDSKENNELSLKASEKSIVLLKNNGILPLEQSKYKKIAVIGPTADSRAVLEGNYNGRASEYITNLQGIRKVAGEDTRIFFSEGSHLYLDRVQTLGWENDRLSEAKIAAKHSDLVILCVGLDATIEGEEGDTGNSFAAGDKTDLFLPKSQRDLVDAVLEIGKPVILVLNAGSAIDLSPIEDKCEAILTSWYSGAKGGLALGNVLFGKVAPSGKLPVTFYYNHNLPEFTDYNMKNRTYRYMEEEALYPFGYGLSYCDFEYSDFKLSQSSPEEGNEVTAEIIVKNLGTMEADEVVEFYLSNEIEEKVSNGKNESYKVNIDISNQPVYSLCAFKRVTLKPGESKKISVKIKESSFTTVLENGERVTLLGQYTIYAGTGQPSKRNKELTGKECQKETILIK